MKVYTTVAIWGAYEDREEKVIYAGTELDKALEAAKNWEFYDKANNYLHIDVWEVGKSIQFVCIEPHREEDFTKAADKLSKA